jgi:transposase InsO family protein
MNEDAKKQIAAFRFGVIADLVGRKLGRGEKRKIVQDKSEAVWDIPGTGRSRISPSTVLHWLRRYEQSGRKIESLYPDERSDKNTSRALDEETALSLIRLKQEYKGASLPVVIQEAIRRRVVPESFRVSRATLYRFFHRQGLLEEEVEPVDRRRFEAELPNDIWQSDALHGPKVLHDKKRRKSYLFAFLDDMSRLIPHAEFYLQENLDAYTDALRKALAKRGLPRKLYVDNGPAFRSHHLEAITAALGIALVHSKPYQPEGRGKIERFFRTVRMQFLSLIDDGLALAELNVRLTDWVERDYHLRVHSSIKETPLARYLRHVELVREAPKEMEDLFRHRVFRQVYRDRTISLGGRIYEAPVELIGKRVTLLHHDHDPARVEITLAGASYGFLVPLDLRVNCRVRREHRLTEIVSDPPRSEPPRGDLCAEGRLFGQGDPDDQL